MATTALAFGLSATTRLTRAVGQTLSRSRCQRARKRARFICSASSDDKKRVVFLGTPPVAAYALNKMNTASMQADSTFSITGVVTQPPAPVGRKRVLTKSPVHALAEELSIPSILTPASARDPEFLDELRALAPDLCITAAYGNFLPKAFLAIPPYGTLNIHPSLLPAFRGAAPVPRALEAGVDTTGVSILLTVLEMDAGPVLAQHTRVLEGHEQGPELLQELFDSGSDALLNILPSVWSGTVQSIEQDHDAATHAAKLSKDESRLTFTENASIVHNKVRGFAGWPGTWGDFRVGGKDGNVQEIRLKILETTILRQKGGMCLGIHNVSFDEEENCLSITCGDGSKIGLLKVQPPGKKPMDARSFWNGLRGKTVERKRVPH